MGRQGGSGTRFPPRRRRNAYRPDGGARLLATDLTPKEKHPKVVALLCVMLLVGMIATALVFGAMLADFFATCGSFAWCRAPQWRRWRSISSRCGNRRRAVQRGPRSIATRRASVTHGPNFSRTRHASRGLVRCRVRYDRIQSPGHIARTLRRPDSASFGRADDNPYSGDGGRRPVRLRAGGALARQRIRSISRRRVRRTRGACRLQLPDILRAASFWRPCSPAASC